MYGIVARMPVTAMASARNLEPKRARTNSAGVTNPCTWHTDQKRASTTKSIG
jgi:hypothetical protein